MASEAWGRTWSGAAFEELQAQVATKLGYPAFVKPCNQGSSVGVGKAANAQELQDALQEAFKYDTRVIIEEGTPDEIFNHPKSPRLQEFLAKVL